MVQNQLKHCDNIQMCGRAQGTSPDSQLFFSEVPNGIENPL